MSDLHILLQSEPASTHTNTSLRILPSGIAPDKDPTFSVVDSDAYNM